MELEPNILIGLNTFRMEEILGERTYNPNNPRPAINIGIRLRSGNCGNSHRVVEPVLNFAGEVSCWTLTGASMPSKRNKPAVDIALLGIQRNCWISLQRLKKQVMAIRPALVPACPLMDTFSLIVLPRLQKGRIRLISGEG